MKDHVSHRIAMMVPRPCYAVAMGFHESIMKIYGTAIAV